MGSEGSGPSGDNESNRAPGDAEPTAGHSDDTAAAADSIAGPDCGSAAGACGRPHGSPNAGPHRDPDT